MLAGRDPTRFVDELRAGAGLFAAARTYAVGSPCAAGIGDGSSVVVGCGVGCVMGSALGVTKGDWEDAF